MRHPNLELNSLFRYDELILLLTLNDLQYLQVIIEHVVFLNATCFGVVLGVGGYCTFAFTTMSLRFVWRLKAIIDTSLNRVLRFLLVVRLANIS